MAIIEEFIKDDNRSIGKRITKTSCIYNSDYIGGEKIVVFNTIGSRERKYRVKASQTLHFDRESAKEMVRILKEGLDL